MLKKNVCAKKNYMREGKLRSKCNRPVTHPGIDIVFEQINYSLSNSSEEMREANVPTTMRSKYDVENRYPVFSFFVEFTINRFR